MSDKLTLYADIKIFNLLKIKGLYIWQEICLKRGRLEEMRPLNRKEIYDELKKLGITTTPELRFFFREYYTYYVQPKIKTCSPKELTVEIKDNQPNEGTSLGRLSPIDPFNK